MNRRSLRVLVLLSALLMPALSPITEARGFRGGTRSFSSRSRTVRPSRPTTTTRRAPTMTSTRTKSTTSAAKPTTTTTTTKPAASPTTAQRTSPTSTTDRALATSKAMAPGSYRDRSQAVKAFQTKYGSEYASRYQSQPATRPRHVPQTTIVDGRAVDVAYNPDHGGYGYMHNGSWRFYDVMRDAAMLNLLMRDRGYHYPDTVAVVHTNTAGRPMGSVGAPMGSVTYHRAPRRRSALGFVFGVGVFLFFVVGSIAMLSAMSRSGTRRF